MTGLEGDGDLGRALDEMAASTDRLLATVDAMTADTLAGPSLLPGWSRAHVLTHLARNADGLANLAYWARTGQERAMYPEGDREAAIEAGARRHLGDLRLDLAESAERLLEAFANFPDEGLQREVAMASGASAYGWGLPMLRTREVEIHHVDLDAGYTLQDWSPAFTARTLDQIATRLRDAQTSPVATLVATDGGADGTRQWQLAQSGPELSGPRRELLAWLAGRSDGATLQLDPPGVLTRAPRWS